VRIFIESLSLPWYYSLGDRAVSPFELRKAWGYMPAVDVGTSIDPWPGIPACPVPASPPPRSDSLDKPIYFVHGYDAQEEPPRVDCEATWGAAIEDYLTDGTPASLTGPALTWGYYANDVNCSQFPGGFPGGPGDREEGIKELGWELAWGIYSHFSRFGESVDAVGHSMGGLIIRAALTGVQRGEPGWPPYLYVEDVTTLATPHRGAPGGVVCGWLKGTQQCQDIKPGSEFLRWLNDNPQSAQGTDWTLIGFDDDLAVPVWSAVPTGDRNMAAGHKIIYPKGQFLPRIEAHSLPLGRTSGTHTIRYCDYFSTSCNMADRETFYQLTGDYDPIRMARYGNYYSDAW
jgi:hypothetical protein